MAQCNLAVMFENGKAGKDMKKAVEWYTKAANQGDHIAKAKLSSLLKRLSSTS